MSFAKILGLAALDLFALFMMSTGVRALLKNKKGGTLDFGMASMSCGIIVCCLFPIFLTFCYWADPERTLVPMWVGISLIVGVILIAIGAVAKQIKAKSK